MTSTQTARLHGLYQVNGEYLRPLATCFGEFVQVDERGVLAGLIAKIATARALLRLLGVNLVFGAVAAWECFVAAEHVRVDRVLGLGFS